MKKLLSVLAVTAAVASPVALAESSPVMFSSLNGFNAPASNAVGGVRLAVLHGKVQQVKGVDFSLVGMSET
ncbi:phaC PHA synthase, partial [Vibrio sp. 10N.261.45.A4]